ncbi:hypothetical protein [Enterobacter hormaechei]|uniref:tail fiber/spike domain-containing protein n=2 Tax=Enterobacter hormaechei TaxID=158836 RepID=UPI0018E067C6|nr:hypothetical protein [Enterobacter hormaechei]
MATTPTNLPVPSESPRDLKFNAGKIDEFVTSLAQQYIDRFGNAHYTIEGLRWLAQQAIAQYGWIPVGTFQNGATLTLPNQILKDTSDGEYYRWDGVFPKSVPSGSTPSSSGGVGIGAWLSVGDSTLRSMLSAIDGQSRVGGATFTQIRAYTGSADEIKCLGRASKRDGGEGWFFLDSTDTTSADDDGTVLVDASNRRWKRAFDGSKKAAWFGVKDGADAATALQAAVNTGGKIEVKDGQYPVSARINVDTTGGTFPSLGRKSKRFDLIGTSPHETTFLPAGNFLRYIGNDQSVPGQGQLSWMQFKNFCVFPTTSGNPVGVGLDIRDCISTNIETVIFRRLDNGVTLSGAISGQMNNCEIDRCRIGLFLEQGNLSPINNVNFIGNKIASNYEFAVKGTIGTRVTFEQGSFESNGWSLDESGGTTSTGGIDIGIWEPMGVLTFKDCYFEADEGLATIIIRNVTTQGSRPGAPVIVNFIGCKFGRGNSRGKGTTHVINPISADGAPIIMNFMGCQFFMQKSFGWNPANTSYYIPNRPYLYCRGLDSCYFSHPEYIDPSLHTHSSATGISIDANGTVLMGPNGISVTKTGAGTYRITSTYGFGTDVNGYQVTGVTPLSGNTILHVNKSSSTSFDVITVGTSGVALDSKFDIIISKPHGRYGT